MLGQGYVVQATVSENINRLLNAKMVWPKMWFVPSYRNVRHKISNPKTALELSACAF